MGGSMGIDQEKLGPAARRIGLQPLIIVAVAALVLGLFLGKGFGVRKETPDFKLFGAQQMQVAANPSTLPANLFVDLARKVKPGVVNISTTKVVKGGGRVFRHFSPFREKDPFKDFFGEDFFDRFFGENPQKDYVQRSLGSGFIINKEGYIITNNHVIEGASEIRVRLSTDKEFAAEVVGRDAKTDLALIKIKSWND